MADDMPKRRKRVTGIHVEATCHCESREPEPKDLKVMEGASHSTALAIGHAEVMGALRESEVRFQALMSHSPAVIFIKDEVGRHLYVNSQFENVFAVSKDQVRAKTVFDFMPMEIAARMAENDQVVFASGRALEIEEAIPGSDGKLRYWLVIRFPIETGQGRLLGGTAIDITERKETEENLRRTQFAMDQAADAIYWIDPQARILYTNAAASAMLGYTSDEFLRMTVHDLNPDFPAEVWSGWWEQVREKKLVSLETNHLTKDGRLIPVDLRVAFLAYGGQEFHCAYVRDISERKRAEEALRTAHVELERRITERTKQLEASNRSLQEEIAERKRAEEAIRASELRYKLLTEATFDGIAIHDQGTLIEVNAGLERMFGYEAGELIGRPIWDLIAPESREVILANMKNGVTGPYEAMGLRKDGTTFPGEVVVKPYRYCGKEVRLVAGRDITERKRLEAQLARHTEELERQVAERTDEISRLMAQRAQTEKLAAVGQLAAGVAHEINNPIAGIRIAFQLVKQAVDPAHPHYEFVGMIDREISRVTIIVQNMYLLYKKRESRTVEPVDVPGMFRDLRELLEKPLAQRNLRVTTHVPDAIESGLFVPQADLFQVLLNFTQNAIDSSKPGGRITLTMREDRDVVRIAVSDDGQGIGPDVLPHIFDPFYTTKVDGHQKSMGLGLAISQSLVTAMGGKIEVQTQLDRGSTFEILFPRHAGARSQDHVKIIKEVLAHDDRSSSYSARRR